MCSSIAGGIAGGRVHDEFSMLQRIAHIEEEVPPSVEIEGQKLTPVAQNALTPKAPIKPVPYPPKASHF